MYLVDKSLVKLSPRNGVLLPGRDWVYINIPRTGSTSACKTLGIPHIHRPARAIPHRRIKFLATFVRNPYDRLVSCWEYCRNGGLVGRGDSSWRCHKMINRYGLWLKKFAADRAWWLKFGLFRPQTQWIMSGDSLLVDFIGNFDNYNTDMHRLCQLLGKSYRKVHANRAVLRRGKPWQRYYTQELRDIVCDVYESDIKLWEFLSKDP